MQREKVSNELKDFFVREFLNGNGEGLNTSTPLLELGIIDSFSIVLLLKFVKDTFDIDIPHTKINAENLKDLNSIASLVLHHGTENP